VSGANVLVVEASTAPGLISPTFHGRSNPEFLASSRKQQAVCLCCINGSKTHLHEGAISIRMEAH
jgi:hypothetical protein